MGGVQYSTYYLARELLGAQNVNVNILLPKTGSFAKLCKDNGIQFKIVNMFQYYSTSFRIPIKSIRIPNPLSILYNIIIIFLNSIKLNKYTKKNGADVVITKGLINHFAGGLVGQLLKIPVVWHVQDLVSYGFFGFFNKVFNLGAILIPTYIICDGQSIQNQLNNSVLPKTKVILNGINVSDLKRSDVLRNQIRNEFGISKDAYVIGHVGRMTPWKGQEALLNAFIDYSSINENAYLFLVGSPLFDNQNYFIKLKSIVSNLGLKNKVFFLGYRTDLQALFSAMDLYIHPSQEKDTSPLSVLSAISSGLPVGLSNIESLFELIELCPSIDIFNSNKRKEIRLLMEKYEDKESQSLSGKINREIGKKYFDISIHSEKIEKIIKQVYKENKIDSI
jgi:glycosyltransferase involved in cell wall biosynthesis